MKSTKRMIGTVAALISVWCLVVPAAEGRSLKKDIKISVREKRVQNMNTEGLTLSFVLEVANASPEPCLLMGYDYRVLVENAEYFRLNKTLDSPLDITASGRTLIALPVKFTYAFIQPSVPDLPERQKIVCTLVGGLIFGHEGRRGERLNVAMTGDFPVFKGIKTEVLPLQVRALSVGGADLTFQAEFANLSSFSVDIESIGYRLVLAGRTVAEGRKTGGRLDPSGSTTLSLPLLIEFFEMGAEMYPLLQKSEAAYRLSGELRILTAWGSQAVPFVQEGAAPVHRVE